MTVYCHNCLEAKPGVEPVRVTTTKGVIGYWLCSECTKLIQIVYLPWLKDAIEIYHKNRIFRLI
jgi:hypothetical protein